MQKHLIFLLLLSLPLLGKGQAPQVDSLRQLLPGASDELRMELYKELSNNFRIAEAWDSCLVYSTKLETLARQAQDTTHLIIAYARRSRSHFAMDDSLQGNSIREKQIELSATYGVRLDNPFNYNYSLIESYNYAQRYLYNPITILCDSSGTLSYEEVRGKAFSSNNSWGNLEQDRVYWMQVRVVASKDRYGDQYFAVGGGSGMRSWQEIDVYYEQSDSLIHLKTGLDRLAKDKAIRDAFNWIKVPMQPEEEIRLFVRVKGQNTSPYISKPLSIYHLKIEDCLELEGYRFLGAYRNSSTMAYDYNYISRSLEVVADPSGEHTLETVQEVWEEKAEFNDWRGFGSDQVHWVKLRLFGSPDFYGQQLFSLGDTYLWSWNKVEVYTPKPTGGYDYQRTGNDLPLWKKLRWHKMNLFTVELGPSDTLEVYLRLEDVNEIRYEDPNRQGIPAVDLFHFDQSAFWSQYAFFTIGTMLFYGIMLASALFFFLFFIISRKRVYGYFSLGSFLFVLANFIAYYNEFSLFPSLLEYSGSLANLLYALTLIFLLLFTQEFLSLKQWKTGLKRSIPIMIGLLLLTALVEVYIFQTLGFGNTLNKLGDFISVLIALSGILIITLAIIAIRRGNQNAWYFLLATIITASIIIFVNLQSILSPVAIFGRAQIYLLFSYASAPILIALALGFRSRQQEKQTQASIAAKAKAEAEKEAAQLASETKSNFLSTVSHELRTPLTSIIGFANINKQRLEQKLFPLLPQEDQKVSKIMQQVNNNQTIIIQEGQRLANLINDVLDLAKIEAGRTDWHLESVDMNALVQQAYQSTALLLDVKQLKYQENLTPDLPTITADHDKLVQVMINLLSNAVKFTDQGSITVSTKLEGDKIIVGVKDTGIGIAPEHQSKVFEKFRQVGDTLTDKPKGTGLGLPICKEIIEYLGGRIWVESNPGEGSLFAFSLPLKKVPPSIKETAKMEELVDELKKKMSLSTVLMPPKVNPNILVVDDDPSIRELLRQELSATGYQVTLAEDGKKALQKVREKKPDMIILDVMMPELNGFDLAAILKNDPKTASIPILILSIVEDQERGYHIGVDRYLHKPIDTDLLLKEVNALLSNGTSSKKVLIIDENQSTVTTMATVLSAKGFEVVEASETNLIEAARASTPDVIILNARLNEREQLMRTLRFEKGLESVLVILYQ